MTTRHLKAELLAAAALILSFAPSGVMAQTTPDAAPQAAAEEAGSGDADIIVTARKRSETLLDVPVAISALSSTTLARYNINDLNAMSSLVPNVTIVKAASGTGASMTIRGVGSTFNDFGIEQTVSVNIDGMQLSRGFITNVAFFDVEQVEVLKGPQALFYGKNSPGGVVTLRSKDPTADFQAGLKAGYEFVADEKYVEGFVSGPVTDTLGARLALRYSDMKGYIHNVATPGPNPTDPNFPVRRGGNGRAVTNDNLTGRLTLKWEPTNDFTATLKAIGNRYRDDGMSAISQAVRCGGGRTLPTDNVGTAAAPVLVADPTGDCKADNRSSVGNMPVGVEAGYPLARDGRNYSEVDAFLSTLTMSYDMGPVSLTSVSGYSHGFFLTNSNYGYTSFDRFPGVNDEKNDIFTQEIRFNTDLGGSIDFAGGVFYENSKRSGHIRSRFASPPTDPATGRTTSTIRFHKIDGETLSAFGQAIWNITDTIELAGGARFTHEKKRTREGNTYVHPLFAPSALPAGRVIDHRFKDDNISPEVTLSWKPQPNLNVYAAYKTGYKSGGASIPTSIGPTATADQLAFGPEKAKGYELGFKGSLLNRRLTFSADVYNYKLKGLQLVMVDTVALPTGGSVFNNLVRNAADARTRGAEFEATYVIDDNWRLNGGVSYNDAKITDFPNAPCWAEQTAATGCTPITLPGGATTTATNRAGDPLSKAPRWVINGGFDFDQEIGSGMALGISGQYKYSSSYRTQDDGAPYAKQDSFVTFDATVRLHEVDDRWELALIGRNLTNKYYLLVTSPRPGGLAGDLHGVIARPREVALQASYRF